MSFRRITTLVGLLLLTAPVRPSWAGAADPPAQAPSPAPAKKKDKEKDKKDEAQAKDDAKAKKPAHVYTDEDLKKARESGSGTVIFLQEVPGQSSGGVDTSTGDENERQWRQRVEQRREAIRAAEARVKELEDRLSALQLDRDPNANALDPNRLQTQADQIAATRTALDAARAEVAKARKAVDDLEEEARKTGVPPGWLR